MSRFTKWTTTLDEIQQMALSRSTIESSASSSLPRTEQEQLDPCDIPLCAIMLSSFRYFFKMAALSRLAHPGIAGLIESWILVELGNNGRSEKPLPMAQLFTISNAKRAVDRYLEIEFWESELRTQFALKAFDVTLYDVRKVAGKVGTTLDDYLEMSMKFLRVNADNVSYIGFPEPCTLVPPPGLFDQIDSGINTGLWEMENGWKPKIQIIFDLFHSQLTTSINTLVQTEDLAPPFTDFFKCFPYPHHLINHPSRSEAVDPSFTFAKLSENEYKKELKIFGKYCAEGGHQRTAFLRFVQGEMQRKEGS
jgi:hypothetical protein